MLEAESTFFTSHDRVDRQVRTSLATDSLSVDSSKLTICNRNDLIDFHRCQGLAVAILDGCHDGRRRVDVVSHCCEDGLLFSTLSLLKVSPGLQRRGPSSAVSKMRAVGFVPGSIERILPWVSLVPQ